MSAEDNVAALRAFVQRAWNEGAEGAFDEFISREFVGGKDRFKGMVLGFREAFPDLSMEAHDIFGAGDKVVSRWTMRDASRRLPRLGTHRKVRGVRWHRHR